jgi:hypothetical protein
MLEELKPNETYHAIGATHDKKVLGVKPFFNLFHTKRVKRKINVKMLASFNSKGALNPVHFKFGDIRYLPKYLMTNMHIFFYNDTVIIILWTKEPIAFNIKSKDAVESFSTYFNTFWKIAKP